MRIVQTNIKRIFRQLELTDGIAIALFVIYVGAFSWMTIRQHQGFRTNALDLAKFDQAIWNTAQGRPFQITLIEESVIQSHFSPILALYAPLYWLWPDIRVLFIAQSICLGGAGLLIYWFFRSSSPWLGLAVYAAYSMHPALHQVNLVEFRRVTIAVLAISFTFYQMLGRRYGWMALGLIVALLSKEDMAFLAIGVGLYVMVAHRSFKVGIPILIVGLVWLLLIPFVVLPTLSASLNIPGDDGYEHARSYFAYLGSSPIEILQTFFHDPTAPLKYLLRPERLRAVAHLCWPAAFLFLLAPEIAVFTLPFLGYMLASAFSSMGRLDGWYPSALLPILYWAVAVGVSRIRRDRWQTILLVVLLAAGFGGWLANSEVWPGRRFQSGRFQVTEHHRQVEVALQQIPTDAVVAAQNPLVPHLSHREHIYLFPWIPGDVQPDYVVLDREMNTYPTVLEAYRSLFYRFLSGTEYEIAQQVDSLYVFRYTGSVFPDVARTDQWDESLTLTGYSVAVAPPGEAFGPVVESELVPGARVRVSLFWHVEQPIAQNYSVFVHLLNADGRLLAQHDSWPADAHAPTSVLPPGTTVRDVHYLDLTETVSPDAILRVGLYESTTGEQWLARDDQEAVTLSLK